MRLFGTRGKNDGSGDGLPQERLREKSYYSGNWPERILPYEHLEPYLSVWMKPHETFAGKRVLDVGAGECTYTRLIADRFGPSEVIACDIFRERMLPVVQSNHNPRMKFVEGDCYALPFAPRSFDVVFGSFILHHLQNLDKAASEIARVLVPGGTYVGIEPSPYNPLHLLRFVSGNRSPNEYLLTQRRVRDVLAAKGMSVSVRYFYPKLPGVHLPFLSSCMGILARMKPEDSHART